MLIVPIKMPEDADVTRSIRRTNGSVLEAGPVEKKRFRVLLVDDLRLIREGIRAVLSRAHDIEVVAEASSGESAIELAKKLHPDVVILDQDMPSVDGLMATHAIKQAVPACEIIIMTDRLDMGKALDAIQFGATGYVLKDIPATNLISAVSVVCNHRAFFHPDITRNLLDHFVQVGKKSRLRQRPGSNGLTPREMEILVEVTNGHSDKAIGTKFMLGKGTVKTHIRHILRKLGCQNRTQAVAYVLRNGLLRVVVLCVLNLLDGW